MHDSGRRAVQRSRVLRAFFFFSFLPCRFQGSSGVGFLHKRGITVLNTHTVGGWRVASRIRRWP